MDLAYMYTKKNIFPCEVQMKSTTQQQQYARVAFIFKVQKNKEIRLRLQRDPVTAPKTLKAHFSFLWYATSCHAYMHVSTFVHTRAISQCK